MRIKVDFLRTELDLLHTQCLLVFKELFQTIKT